ncbi:MAG TPA: tRNA (guanosine(37)-N1)-methyltransferase TrmD [Steroidobacteraceae bacterium]|jgi:tRNA (guanine37-N1)-methyltransferase|nr:tRNA (guanosine(37)-N1)-methyltransferase TrmD [Steroidobacteraceae bacterium]
MHIEVVTLFPGLIQEALRYGVLGRAIERGLLQVETVDPRSFTHDAHRSVDDRPYGGGPGMVLTPEPLCAAIAAAAERSPPGSVRVALSAQGELLNQARVAQWSQRPGLILIAGRYEGIDERVLQLSVDQEISIGDYVVSGGEMPALVLIDALARLLPGALGCARSNVEESFDTGLLDWPHYTRPEIFRGQRVPEVLSSGDHAAIRRWRMKQSIGRTWLRRPELIGKTPLDTERRVLLEEFLMEQLAKAADN